MTHRRPVHALDGIDVGALVVSRLLNGGSDQNPAVTSWNQIDLRGTNDVADQLVRRGSNRKHLSLNRTSRELMRRQLPGPCARTIDDGCGMITALLGADAGST